MKYPLQHTSFFLHVLPITHIAGLIVIMVFFFAGANTGMIERFNSTKLRKAFLDFNPTHFLMVPKFFDVIEQRICQGIQRKGIIPAKTFLAIHAFCGYCYRGLGINLGRVLFKSIRSKVFGSRIAHLGTGGAHCNKKSVEFFLNLGATSWSNYYATTETNIPATATGVFDNYPIGTEGKVGRFDGIDIKINDPDKNGIGEIFVKTILIMKGYFREPHLTATAFDKDGYFMTGDMGYIDKNGYLHVTGRAKEAIHLKTGEKVAPADIDNLYSTLLPDTFIASCGIPSQSDEMLDEIHIFVESNGANVRRDREIHDTIMNFSSHVGTSYKISQIHFIKKIPVTSIGKVKRYQLKDMVISERKSVLETVESPKPKDDIENTVLSIIANHAQVQTLISESRLRSDLGLDSLTMLEVVIDIESSLDISIADGMGSVETVQDLIDLVKIGYSNHARMLYEIERYPVVKTRFQLGALRLLMGLVRSIWNFKVSGLENLPSEGNYILCPNHQSRLDVIVTWAAIEGSGIDLSKICCLAEDSLLNNPIFKIIFMLVGGIPIDRYGNPIPALKRCMDCITSGYSALIHPEGTVTKDGNMNEFKGGAAQLAIGAKIPIIPVRIEGTRTIWRLYTIMPKIFNYSKMQRYKVHITLGEAILPESITVEEMTTRVRKAVEELGNEG